MSKALLVVEDNGGDALLLRQMFNESGLDLPAFYHVETLAEAEAVLSDRSIDMIVLDLGLPDAQGLEGVRRISLAAPAVPLVVLTGHDDEGLAAQALKEGAQDYLIKGQIESRGLLRALRHAVERKSLDEAARVVTRRITHSAEHDFLTGLSNRLLVKDRIDQAIAFAARHSSKAAILFLDLDGFKQVNDSLGHSVGDKLLQSVATRLVECVRGCDTVSRQGGDEFVILLSEVVRAEDAAVIGKRILEAVRETHTIDGQDIYITTSIGISVYPDDGQDAESLIRAADVAMYQAKKMGRQSFRFFMAAMHDKAVERQSIEADLRGALQGAEFALDYQPKIQLATGTIVGVEAILRWTHPIRGMVPLTQFVPVAEDCGLIRPIGEWVLRQACLQAQTWRSQDLAFGTVAVNVSAGQLKDETFLKRLQAILDETGLDPRSVELELKESALMESAEATGAAVQRMREQGVRIAIDDFGTGYSSLSYLQRFPVDILKIDRSFVRGIGHSAQDDALLTAIIGMAKALRLRIVAVGVETPEQLRVLRALNCDEAQGSHLSRPGTAGECETLFRSQTEKPPHWAVAA